MHNTGLMNYELYSSSLVMSLYEDKNAQEEKKKFTFHFIDLWGCQWYWFQEGHKCSEYINI